ncbi:MAG: hypothetical protein KGZ25_05455, partial [Planctomycetes bacterium]|nr:hypothetical protein [Planctomycetota bacterium]
MVESIPLGLSHSTWITFRGARHHLHSKKNFPRVRTAHGIHAANHMFGNNSFRGAYPADKDWSLFDKAQELRQFGGGYKSFLERWMKRHPKSKGPNLVLGRCRGGVDFFSIYAEEFHMTGRSPDRAVFGDEWSGPGRGKQHVQNLAPSYIDFRAWVASHFVRRGLGVYFDNTFPMIAPDTVTTSAYELPDGSVQPSYGMWARREYFRRIWIIHHTMNPSDPTCQPEMQLHITNGHVLPFMTWNDCNLDLEWRRAAPMQKAFSADLMRTETTGLQTGCRPLAFSWGDDLKAFGALMVHECNSWGWSKPHKTYMPMLFEIGYGLPDCNIYNYWDPADPVHTSNDEDVKSLLVERNGKA